MKISNYRETPNKNLDISIAEFDVAELQIKAKGVWEAGYFSLSVESRAQLIDAIERQIQDEFFGALVE